jgi:hypothetical protein
MADGDTFEHPGYVLRVLRNDGGTAFKFPTVSAVVEPGEQTPPVVYAADQQVPQGFTQVGADVPCDEHGAPLTEAPAAPAPAPAAAPKRAADIPTTQAAPAPAQTAPVASPDEESA